MATRRDLLLAVLVMTGLSLVMAFGSIGLFTRMAPAIDEIVERHVQTLESTRDMLGVLAGRWGEAVGEPEVARLEEDLEKLRASLGEDGALLAERVVDTMSAAIYGERAPAQAFVGAVDDIAHQGYASMRAADREARRLGEAGAWAAAILGLFACLLGIAVYHRLDRRIARPTAQLTRVLVAARDGDAHERCQALDADHELGVAVQALNHVLDREQLAQRVEMPSGEQPAAYRALIHLLLREPGDALVMTPGVGIVAATPTIVTRLFGEDGPALRERLTRAVAGTPEPGITTETLAPDLVLVRLAS